MYLGTSLKGHATRAGSWERRSDGSVIGDGTPDLRRGKYKGKVFPLLLGHYPKTSGTHKEF